MKFVNSKTLLDQALSGGYAIPALNTNGATYDITRAILEAAEELKSPLIIQCYEPNLEYRGYDYFVRLVKLLAESCTIPISIQLDHGKDETSVLKAVKAGFTSIMIDYAGKTLDENIKGTQRIIELFRPLGVSVEAEVGNIVKTSDEENKTAQLVDINDVIKFTNEADVDMLAVAVGTRHGIFKEQKDISYEHIKNIRKVTDIPLVLHGTCGISLDIISKCVKSGMSKINFGEGLRMNYIQYFNEFSVSLNHEHHAWRIMQACKERLKDDIKDIIRAVGSENKA